MSFWSSQSGFKSLLLNLLEYSLTGKTSDSGSEVLGSIPGTPTTTTPPFFVVIRNFVILQAAVKYSAVLMLLWSKGQDTTLSRLECWVQFPPGVQWKSN